MKKMIIKKFYINMTKKAERILLAYYEEEEVNIIFQNCAGMYDEIIERLPYLGGIRNFYTPIIIVNGWFVCIYKAMHASGIEDDVIGYVISRATDELFDLVPAFLAKRIKKTVFSGFFKRFIKRQAKRSHLKKYPGDWLYTAKTTKWGKNGEEREITLIFDECGVHKYYEQEDVAALKKYCNFCDPQYSIRYNLGLDANHTMAQGCEKCVLSFNNQRETKMPENIVLMTEHALKILKPPKYSSYNPDK